jgi:hypothetical protein
MAQSKLLPWIAGLALALASSPGAAQTTNKPAAEVLFQRGRDVMREQRLAEACAKFEASQEIGRRNWNVASTSAIATSN